MVDYGYAFIVIYRELFGYVYKCCVCFEFVVYHILLYDFPDAKKAIFFHLPVVCFSIEMFYLSEKRKKEHFCGRILVRIHCQSLFLCIGF